MRVGTRCVWMQQRDRQRRHAKHATKRTNNPNCKQATRQVHTSNAHGKRQAVLDPPTPRPRCRRGARPGGGITQGTCKRVHAHKFTTQCGTARTTACQLPRAYGDASHPYLEHILFELIIYNYTILYIFMYDLLSNIIDYIIDY